MCDVGQDDILRAIVNRAGLVSARDQFSAGVLSARSTTIAWSRALSSIQLQMTEFHSEVEYDDRCAGFSFK